MTLKHGQDIASLDAALDSTIGKLNELETHLTTSEVQTVNISGLPGVYLNWLHYGPIYSFWTSGTINTATTLSSRITLIDSSTAVPLAKYVGDDLINIGSYSHAGESQLFPIYINSTGLIFDNAIAGEIVFAVGDHVALSFLLLLGD